MTDTANLALPFIEAAQAQKHVTHNEALRLLDTLVQLAVLDRDLATPPGAPAEGQRWIIAASPTGAWAGHAGQIAAWQDGGWQFSAPQTGWLAYAIDESALLAWSGSAWLDAVTTLTSLSAPQNLDLLGVGTTADTTNPFSAKLNNALWVAKTLSEGGNGDLRYKLSKEAAGNTASLLFQDNFSGRAEIGLSGDDDFHFKVSADGSAWTDGLLLDRASGAAKFGAGLFWRGIISPPTITADQNDFNPSGAAGATVLRLASDASRNITGLSGGSTGRLIIILNVGANPVALKDANASSSASNRFSFGTDLVLAAGQGGVLWYDGGSSRWRLIAATAAGGGGGGGGSGSASGTTYNNATSGLAATDVQAAIDELDAEKAGLVHTHVAADISDSTTAGRALLTADDAAAQRSDLGLGDAATKNVGTTTGTVAAGTDSRIVGAVQTSRQVNSGGGLTGGGDLSADRTLAVGAGAGITVNADDVAIANDGVTFAKMQNIATDSLIGRDTAATGDPENILLNATLEMDGSGNLRRAALTGDVTASAGSNATAIANDAVTNVKLANMATATFKGRTSAATGDPEDLTATQATALLNAVVGDSGSGGTKGLVPAAASGDTAAKKYLKADGTFSQPAFGPHPGYVTGRYYYGAIAPYTLTTQGLIANTIYWVPFYCSQPTTWTEIGARVTTSAASSNIQLAIYAAANGVPIGAPLVSTSSLSAATTGARTAAISQTLPAGFYWLGIMSDGTPAMAAFTDLGHWMLYGLDADTTTGNTAYTSQTFGTWPTNPTVGYTGPLNLPQVWLRK